MGVGGKHPRFILLQGEGFGQVTSRCGGNNRVSALRGSAITAQLVAAELRSEMSRAYLGFAWWVIEPIIYMMAFYLVFGLIFQRDGPAFIPMLLTGLVTWRWFDNTVRTAMNAIPRNKALMQQVYIPKILFILVAIAAGMVKFLVVLGLLILFLLFYGVTPSSSWLALPVVVFVQLVFISGISTIIGLLVPFLPDLRIVVPNILLLVMFLSGVFYLALDVPENIRSYFFLNPMAVIIDSMRNTLVYDHFPDWTALFWVLVAGLTCLALAIKIFRVHDLTYPKLGL